MKRSGLVLVVVMAMVAPMAWSQETGESAGRYATYTISLDSSELPDGGRVDVSHFRQIVFSDAPGHPLDGTNADCVGMMIFTASGAITSASGSCYIKDVAGNGASMWWRMDEAATADCPMICGSWGYFDGYGAFKGISGSGTWKQTSLFADGNMGTWEGSFSLK